MKPNYELKAKVLNSGLCKLVKNKEREQYLFDREGIVSYCASNKLIDFVIDNNVSSSDLEEAHKVNYASYKRVKRLKERIERYLTMGECIWLTLTFTDDILAKTNQETRRKYVSRFLKSQSASYVANIDYGKQTEREHYHALVLCDYLDKSKWLYGFSYTERVKNHVNAAAKLSKYVSKLTNHAIKETTKRQVYIYSRS